MTDRNTTSSDQGWPKTNGMTVPDGYFDDFAKRMMAKLPAEVPQPVVVERAWWQKMKPYTYMAAMFAGAYLMLNIFSIGRSVKGVTFSQSGGDMIAQVVNTTTLPYVDDYISLSDFELYDDLYESGFEIPETI